MPITRQAPKLNTQPPANTSQIAAHLNMQLSSSSSFTDNEDDKAPNPPSVPVSATDWFQRQFEIRSAQLGSDSRGFLTTQRTLFLSYFEAELKLLKSSVWYKNTPRTTDACYERAYQEALLEFANAVGTNKIPFFLKVGRTEFAKQILNDVIAAEMQASNDSNNLSDIAHYATAVLLLLENYSNICTSNEKGKEILGHLKDAAQPSQLPKALIQLAYLYKTGIDHEMKRDQQIQESVKYYLGAAEQDNASAQNHVASFYLRGILGRDLSFDQRIDKGFSWLEKAAENGNDSAKLNMIDLKQSLSAVEAYKTYNTI